GTGPGNVRATTDGLVGRCLARLARPVAAFAIRDRWGSSPQRVFCPDLAKHGPSTHGPTARVAVGARLLSRLPVPDEDRGGLVWQGNPSGSGLGGQDAPLAARQKGRHRPRASFGGGARVATGVHARGTSSV